MAGAVFCNHCGTRMPAVCQVCWAGNPPESRFCHECGASLTARHTAAAAPFSRTRETGIGDIGTDLKTLGADLATYAAPRIRRAGAATGRGVKAGAVAVAPRVKSLAQRLKPYRPETTELPAVPTSYAGGGIVDQWPAPAAPAVACPRCHRVGEPGSLFCFSCGMPLDDAAPAVACPRCHRVSEPGALFCFSCGLPLDDAAPAARRAPAYAGQPAGFWIRLAAWIIDSIVLSVAAMPLIAVWPGFGEYFTTDTLWHGVDLLLLVLGVLYYTVGVSVWATTIGKRLLGLYVLRPDGAKVGPGRAAARCFASILSLLPVGVGYLMIGLRRDKRGLHDLIGDTVAVRR